METQTEEEIVTTSLEDEEGSVVAEVIQDAGQPSVEITVETVVSVKVIDDTRERITELLERTLNLVRGKEETPKPTTSATSD